MHIFEADSSLKQHIDQFYVEQGYHSNWSESERAFVYLDGDQVVGSVKVEEIHGISILRGMYIDSSYQKQGLGTKLLKYIESALNKTTAYCMPLSHVSAFYEQIGFEEVPITQYPEFLIQRCEKYVNMGYKIKTMVRRTIT